MLSSEEKAARETLRRLHGVLDEPPFDDEDRLGAPDDPEDLPTDAEARALVAELGIDVPALAARLRARVAEYQAARAEAWLRDPSA